MLNYMLTWVRTFWGDEEGATAIEYGLIIALVAIALIVVFTTFGTSLGEFFESIGARVGEIDVPGDGG